MIQKFQSNKINLRERKQRKLNPNNLKRTQFSWLKLEVNVELSHINFMLQKTFKAQSEIKIRTVKVILNYYCSIIREKGESQNGYFKKTKHAKFSAKTNTFTPWYAHVCAYQVKNVCFCGKFGVFCFLEIPVLRFALLPCYRRIGTL